MKKQKLYFRSIEDNNCEPIEGILNDAKFEGLSEVRAIEAIPSDEIDNIWCTHYGEVIDRSDCSKAVCPYYESKSGRGKCSNRGKLYDFGEEVVFKIENEAI